MITLTLIIIIGSFIYLFKVGKELIKEYGKIGHEEIEDYCHDKNGFITFISILFSVSNIGFLLLFSIIKYLP